MTKKDQEEEPIAVAMERLGLRDKLADSPIEVYDIAGEEQSLLDRDCPWMRVDKCGSITFPVRGKTSFKDFSKMLATEVADDDLRARVQRLLTGDIVVFLQEYTTQDESGVFKCVSLQCNARDGHGQLEAQPLFGTFFFHRKESEDSKESDSALTCWRPNEWVGRVAERVPFIVAKRVLHRFVRQHSSKLKLGEEHVLRFLVRSYAANRFWKDHLDITLLCARYIMVEKYQKSCGSYRETTDSLIRLGQALEAVGRSQDAALWYSAIAETAYEGTEFEVAAWCSKGERLLHLSQYEDAEVTVLYSLKRLMALPEVKPKGAKSVDPNTPVLCLALQALIKTYALWSGHLVSNGTVEQQQEHGGQGNERMGLLLMVLHYAGCSAQGHAGALKSLATKTPARVFQSIRGAVKKRKGARQILYNACIAENVEAFHRTLRSILVPGTIHVDIPTFIYTSPGVHGSTKKESRNRIRLYEKAQGGSKYETLCSGPNCRKRGTDFKGCPCFAAFYCSKQCQTEHWKGGHKLSCPKLGKNNLKSDSPSTTANK